MSHVFIVFYTLALLDFYGIFTKCLQHTNLYKNSKICRKVAFFAANGEKVQGEIICDLKIDI